jgi:hypothetical protein
MANFENMLCELFFHSLTKFGRYGCTFSNIFNQVLVECLENLGYSKRFFSLFFEELFEGDVVVNRMHNFVDCKRNSLFDNPSKKKILQFSSFEYSRLTLGD